uniref:Uncharacterized protein n=1 Tax=Schistosoma mansoni TaxID=6183 RepID=A0A5K4F6F4_SCHMA
IQSKKHFSAFFAVLKAFSSLHTVNGQYEPAYLQTNMDGNDTNTNTFRVIHEQTAALAFEWKQMTHQYFSYVSLVQDIEMGFDKSVEVENGNMGLLKAIGEPCEVSNYRAEGYYKYYINRNFQTYLMTYKRVPRIKNVNLQLTTNMRPRLMWEREGPACEPTDSVIIFKGYSSQHLQMVIISSDEVDYYMNDFQTTEGMEGVFILFNKHGDRFSLPTMGKMFFLFFMHCEVFL